MKKISAVLLTKNEERNIDRCLRTLQWVDEIVDQIDETALVREPDSRSSNSALVAGAEITSAPSSPKAAEKLDEKGRPCMILPRLNPMDCYWIYNPDGYYRLP